MQLARRGVTEPLAHTHGSSTPVAHMDWGTTHVSYVHLGPPTHVAGLQARHHRPSFYSIAASQTCLYTP